MNPIRIGIVGCGKIARDQHLPAILANPRFALAAIADPHARLPGVANFTSLEAMLDAQPELDAVAVCTPPHARYEAARVALTRGKHVLLEKPPCSSVAQIEHLTQISASLGRTLFTAWHSRYAPAVAAAGRLLEERTLRRVQVTWLEDARQWHPGQTWVCEAAGFGVFDAGINALSILTQILSEPLFARSARLYVPANWTAPVAAEVELESAAGAEISAALDFRHPSTPTWDIDFATDEGHMKLSHGGAALAVDGDTKADARAAFESEYAAIYRRFEELIGGGCSEVDARPLQCLADIFLIAQHIAADLYVI